MPTTCGAGIRSARFLILACVVSIAGCGDDSPDAPAAAPEDAGPLRAELLTVQPVSWPTIVRTQGSLFADEVAVVGTKVAGRVAQVHVDLGDRVTAGDPLVTLDQNEFRLAVEQAQAQLEQARAAVGLSPDDPLENLDPENAPPVREVKAVWDEARTKSERWQMLARQNAVTESDLQAVLAAEQVAAAQYASALNSVREKIALIGVRGAELAMAQEQLAETVVPAPFDGLVQERHVAPGSFVQIGSRIATFVDTNPLHFRGMMPERHARSLELGQDVALRIESVPAPRLVKVTRISPTLDPLSRSLLFEAEVANVDHRLRTGLFAEAAVTIDPAAKALAIPDDAIVQFAGVEKVWRVTDGNSHEQQIVTGARREGLVEILHGLASGDRIVRDGAMGRAAPVEDVGGPVDPPSAGSAAAAIAGSEPEQDPHSPQDESAEPLVNESSDPDADSETANEVGGP